MDCSVLTVSIWGEQAMFFMLSYLVFPLERHLNGLRSPKQISLVLRVKKKKFWQAGILHIGPKWALEKGSTNCCGWLMTGVIWCNFLCPKILFLAVFLYLDWVYCSQLPQNASPITYKSYSHMLHRILFLVLVFWPKK